MMQMPRGKQDLAAWLFWQESAHPKTWDLGIERIGKVWQALGAPRIAKHIVTIAGTNGKGSCVAWGEAICRAHDVSVASFTSPHILDYRERIRFNDETIFEADLCIAFDAVDEARGDISLTYFEWSALGAFYAMAQKQMDVALLEVGLGGRLDAVNIIDADAACFTEIGLDHMQWLGDTVEKIANEKAGIMREAQLVAFADSNPPITLCEKVDVYHTTNWRYGSDIHAMNVGDRLILQIPAGNFSLPLPKNLPGEHQYGHFAAMATLLGNWIELTQEGLAKASLTAHNTARLMVKNSKPRYLIDVAHNPDSAAVLVKYMRHIRRDNEKMIVVCGMLKDKDQQSIFSIMKIETDSWFLASLAGERGADVQTLSQNAIEVGIEQEKLVSCNNVISALNAAEKVASSSDTIVIMGSFVTVTEVLRHWSENE